MAQQRAGQKRKVVEVPRPVEGRDDDLFNSNFDGVLEDEGDSEDDISQDDDDDDDSTKDADEGGINGNGEELDSDEIPTSEDEDDVRQQLKHLETGNGRGTSVQHPVGNDTAKRFNTLPFNTSVEASENQPVQQPNHSVTTDANGNPRYIYGDIDPAYDSDDSDAPPTSNTIGNIPLSYYDAYPHIGYNINGRRINRPAKGQALDSLLDSIDIPEGWTGLTDPATGKPLQLSKEELELLKKLTRNEAPGDGYDLYPDMIEYFTGPGMEETMPLTAAPEPKRRFIPSRHEHKRVMKMVKAIKEGRIQPWSAPKTEAEMEKEEEELLHATYDVWANEQPRPDHPMNIPAPKLPPPGYAESYHPPKEYLPDKDEREEWETLDPEDRDRAFLPQDHSALRKVPGYAQLVKEKFERCLDLYLAPRVRRSKLNVDPESLLPQLPDPAELRPFPTTNSTVYRGHEGRVRSVAIDPAGEWVASGGDDGTVRMWELTTGRQLWSVRLSREDAVNVVSWRPGVEARVLAACCGEHTHLILPQGELCNPAQEARSREVLDAGFGYAASNSSTAATGPPKPSSTSWTRSTPALQTHGVLLSLTLRSPPKTLSWHRRGDYFTTVCPSSSSPSTAIAIHTLSKHLSQQPFKRLRGLAQTACFHPSKPLFFAATRQSIRVYDLAAQKLEKELRPGARWISSIALHPLGSNLLVASYDRRLLWHDLELGPTPYKTLRYHAKAIRSVAFHPALPLFVDASDDGTLQVFHGKVVGDSLENATIVPLKVLSGHRVRGDLGALAVAWHPAEAWCVSAGADGTIRLWT